MAEHLENENITPAIDFVKEFSPYGHFKDQYAQISFGDRYPIFKLMKEVLICNLTFFMMVAISKKFGGHC